MLIKLKTERGIFIYNEDRTYLILTDSTSGMLQANKLLTGHAIKTELRPAPPEHGSVCAIAILIEAIHLEQAKSILKENQISLTGIYENKRTKLDHLVAQLKGEIITDEFLKIIKQIEMGKDLTFEEIVYLLKMTNEKELDILYNIADRMRREIVGDVVDIRGAIEFSNVCTKDCTYCGIRKNLLTLDRYRMSEEEIMEIVYELHDLGIQTVILQSGEDAWWTVDKINALMKRIKTETGMKITLSVGVRTFDEYASFKKAGANNYLLKVETTNPNIFKATHPDDDLDQRVQCAKWLRELGYLNGSGMIIGLPEQTAEDIANDILYFKEMGINMIGIGPFVPAIGTPLQNLPHGNIELTLKAVAITRIVCKRVYLPATTALASLDPKGQEKALSVGANTIMLVNTPKKYRENYQIYSSKLAVDIESAIKVVKAVNRELPSYLKIGAEDNES